MSEHEGISIIDWSGERVYITCVSVCLSMSTLVPVDAAMCLGPLSRHWSHLVRLGDYNLLTRCWECSHISPRTRTHKTVVMTRGGGKEEGKATMKDVVKAAGIFKGNDFFQEFYPTAQHWTLLNVNLLSTISLSPYFPLTDDLHHQWKSCFVSLPLNKAPFTLFFLFYIKSEEQNWATNARLLENTWISVMKHLKDPFSGVT